MKMKTNSLIIKCLFLILFGVCTLSSYSKGAYIPFYDNKIIVIDNGKVDSVTNNCYMLDYSTGDGLVKISIFQQVVTPELIKQIKKMRRIQGWASVAAVSGAFSSGISLGQLYNGRVTGYNVRNYIESNRIANTSASLADEAGRNAEDLSDLLVEALISNNSDKEILVNDIEKGLTWFIMPHTEMVLPLEKNDDTCIRLSSVNPLDENVRYFQILPKNKLLKYEVELETDSFWIVPNTIITREDFHSNVKEKGGYLKIDKVSMQTDFVTDDDFNKIKKEKKNK